MTFVLASLCSEECKFEGIAALGPRKEYRMRLLARELSKMGASITETGNGFFVRGGRLVGAEVDCEGDPKVGMALSIAAIASAGATTLQGMECIYPEFFLNLTGLGALIR
jgi:3-phosphoshikimate 1-carboxyvinyltransferase